MRLVVARLGRGPSRRMRRARAIASLAGLGALAAGVAHAVHLAAAAAATSVWIYDIIDLPYVVRRYVSSGLRWVGVAAAVVVAAAALAHVPHRMRSRLVIFWPR
ncbi:hypothetical protein U7230_14960 [Carboxydochorda subterranea]|uniref:Uncharacterized protein n=1 Tax=Carboxydichorda subterranea TaxID=3109565 RepID=A0ABZ1BX28_9FIRM|nr:hypothetical protein [Limnochorda sp. L945t]WRP17359.1 hypothetical protein U7230_14960 [Limnochorda sp. L945t]